MFPLPQIMILNNGYLKVANYSDAIDNFLFLLNYCIKKYILCIVIYK